MKTELKPCTCGESLNIVVELLVFHWSTHSEIYACSCRSCGHISLTSNKSHSREDKYEKIYKDWNESNEQDREVWLGGDAHGKPIIYTSKHEGALRYILKRD